MIKESENSAPFSMRTFLKLSTVSCFSERCIKYSAESKNYFSLFENITYTMCLPKSLSFMPRWFSNSVHTFDTNDRYSNFSISLIFYLC